jgi:HEAT repeat protein
MPILVIIWTTAGALASIAICWMLSLIVLRLLRQRADDRRAKDRAVVMRALLALLRGDETAEARLSPYIGRARLMAESILELQGVVRGADLARVLARLRDLGVVKVLAARLRLGSKAGRLLSLEALSAIGGEEAQMAMRHAFGFSEPMVRIAAVKGLIDSGAPPSVGEMLDHVVQGRMTASGFFAELLGDVVSRRPDEAMEALTRSELTLRLRTLLLDGLGRSGAYHALPVLIDATRSAEPEVRTAAVRALGRLKHPAAAAALGAALSDQQWIVRAAACEAAGAAGLSQFTRALALLLNDPQWWVRFRAGAALRRLGPGGIRELTTAAADGRDLARRAAAMALAEAV